MPWSRSPPCGAAPATDSKTSTRERIVIDELLCFVFNKIDTLPEPDIINICVGQFSEDDIEKSRRLLYELLGKRTLRKTEGKGKRSLQDIIKILKETDPDDLPTFAAHELNRLPPVTFDHIDVTSFLKELTVLRKDVADLCEASKEPKNEENMIILQNEVARLKEEVQNMKSAHASPYTQQCADSAQTDRRCPAIAAAATARAPERAFAEIGVQCNFPIKSISELHCNITSHCENNELDTRRPRQVPAPPPPAPAQLYSAVVAENQRQRNQEAQPTRQPRRRRGSLRKAEAATAPADQQRAAPSINNDGFVLVRSRKRRQHRSRNERGTVPAAVTKLKAADPVVNIYLSRLHKNTSVDMVKDHIRETRRGRIEGPIEASVELLESTKPTNFKAFRLCVPAVHQKTFLSPDFWPEGTVFRRFREARPKLKSL